jgi:LuxR family maltose regulon positive regulatory protein
MAEARASIERLETLAAAVENPSLEQVDIDRNASLAKAWYDLTEGACDAAAGCLEVQLQGARENGKLLEVFNMGTALALAWLGVGRLADSMALFTDLCRQAQAAGAERSLLDQPVATDGLIRLAIAHAQRQPAPMEVIAFMERLLGVSAEVTSSPGSTVADTEALSPREHRILVLISQGLSNKEIARNLGVTAETVKSHLKKIYPKLGVQNRAQAAAHLLAQTSQS